MKNGGKGCVSFEMKFLGKREYQGTNVSKMDIKSLSLMKEVRMNWWGQ